MAEARLASLASPVRVLEGSASERALEGSAASWATTKTLAAIMRRVE
jgi:hypothetical protein